MPPVLLEDAQLAAVFSYIFNSWGNKGEAPTLEEIAALRAKTKYPTLADLRKAMVGTELPTAPEGWQLEVAAELTFSPVRLAMHVDGVHILALSQQGDIWQWNPEDQAQKKLFAGSDYLDASLGDALVMGLTVDKLGRLYVTSNQRNKNTLPVSNEVTVFRSEPWTAESGWQKLKPWFRQTYPFGVGPYNHGLSHIAQGPDGMLYVTSGARTDGGEPGSAPDYDKGGETPLTATLWQLNPEEENPKLEIYARGLRNSYGFCWDNTGRMIATENGPDAEPAEELNVIKKGSHYGFPFQYSDWDKKPYSHTPDMPEGLKITRPVKNLGPDAGGSSAGLSTFDAHSCPSGIVWLDESWPAPFNNAMVTARFGNLLKLEKDVGFDVLLIQPDWQANTAKVTELLTRLGRPIDVLKLDQHRLLIAEYCRGTSLASGIGTPGRLLLLKPKPAH